MYKINPISIQHLPSIIPFETELSTSVPKSVSLTEILLHFSTKDSQRFWGNEIHSLHPFQSSTFFNINCFILNFTSSDRLKQRGYRWRCRHIDFNFWKQFERLATVNAGRASLLCELKREVHWRVPPKTTVLNMLKLLMVPKCNTLL